MTEVDAVLFKHEDEVDGLPVGPVYLRRNGERKPYALGKYGTKWLALGAAQKIAETEKLPLREE